MTVAACDDKWSITKSASCLVIEFINTLFLSADTLKWILFLALIIQMYFITISYVVYITISYAPQMSVSLARLHDCYFGMISGKTTVIADYHVTRGWGLKLGCVVEFHQYLYKWLRLAWWLNKNLSYIKRNPDTTENNNMILCPDCSSAW